MHTHIHIQIQIYMYILGVHKKVYNIVTKQKALTTITSKQNHSHTDTHTTSLCMHLCYLPLVSEFYLSCVFLVPVIVLTICMTVVAKSCNSDIVIRVCHRM